MSDYSRFFYFHVPKTAGTSINSYFCNIYPDSLIHAENRKNDISDAFDYVSGHIAYSDIIDFLDWRWIKLITLREPYSHIVSHLSWIRKLADKGEEERFDNHPEAFQKIAMKLNSLDLSKPEDIVVFREWVDYFDVDYLVNTQTLHLDSSKDIDVAIDNLRTIEYVGILEEVDGFLKNLEYEFEFKKRHEGLVRENVNPNKYGFDISNEDTRKALYPFVDKDLVVYEEAKNIYYKQNSLYSSVSLDKIVGYVDSITPQVISGWCRSNDSLQKLKVELRMQGKVIATTMANKYRADLKYRNVHPTGRCAFEFELSSTIDVTRLSVYVANSNIEIAKL